MVFIVDKLVLSPPTTTPLSYTSFYDDVVSHKVKKVTITGRDIEYTATSGILIGVGVLLKQWMLPPATDAKATG